MKRQKTKGIRSLKGKIMQKGKKTQKGCMKSKFWHIAERRKKYCLGGGYGFCTDL
jgi:hypothetical protein